MEQIFWGRSVYNEAPGLCVWHGWLFLWYPPMLLKGLLWECVLHISRVCGVFLAEVLSDSMPDRPVWRSQVLTVGRCLCVSVCIRFWITTHSTPNACEFFIYFFFWAGKSMGLTHITGWFVNEMRTAKGPCCLLALMTFSEKKFEEILHVVCTAEPAGDSVFTGLKF